jgi:hypothetical protein
VYAVDAVPVGEDVAGAPVLALPTGSDQTETIGTVPDDVSRIHGIVADRAGTWLYLTVGQELTDAGDFPNQLRAMDTATGAVSEPVTLCTDGSLDRPRLTADGEGVLATAACSDDATLQNRVYVLQP